MQNKQSKQKGYFIFLICYIAYTSIYVARLNLSVATPSLTSYGITSERIGILNGVFFCIYALGRLISGKISDRTAPYKMISLGLLFTGISNILFGFLPPFAALVFLWSVNAVSQSMLWSSVLLAISSAYGNEKAKKLSPYTVTSVAFGNIVGILLNTFIINKFGTAFAFIIPGGITLILATVCFIFLKKIPFEEQNNAQTHTSFSSLLRLSSVRNASLYAFAHGIMKDNVTAWMTVFLADVYGLDLSGISYFVLFIPIVGFVGRMLYPLVFKLCKNSEHSVSLIGFAVCILSSVPLAIGNIGAPASVVCLSLVYASVSLINTTLLSVFPLNYASMGCTASVSGLEDFCTYLGAGLGSLVFGFMISNLGYGSMFICWASVSLLSFIPVILLLKKK